MIVTPRDFVYHTNIDISSLDSNISQINIILALFFTSINSYVLSLELFCGIIVEINS